MSTSVSSGRIVTSARSWIGTPYHHQACLKGVGVDCLGLVRGVWREIYGCDAETPPAYSPDWAEADQTERMLAAARRHLIEVDAGAQLPGDVVIFRLKRGVVAKHAAILSGPGIMIHAMEGVPVSEVVMSSWWQRRVAAVFRFPGA